MFEKNDTGIRLALSLSEANDKRIVGGNLEHEAERLHRLAMDPEGTMRAERGVPRR